MSIVARQNPRGIGLAIFRYVDWLNRFFGSRHLVIIKATRKPDVLVLSEIHG
jgi:hypothetical protein